MLLWVPAQVVAQTLESGEALEEDGIEAAFDLLNEVSEHARSGALIATGQHLDAISQSGVITFVLIDLVPIDNRIVSVVWSAGLWVGDCFIYNNSSWRLCYCVGGEVRYLAFKKLSYVLHMYVHSGTVCSNTLVVAK